MHMPLDMRTSQAYLLPARLLNIHQPGRDLSCLLSRAREILIARMKLIPVHRLIKDKSLLMIDDSMVRGTQLRETTEFLYRNGAKEVHIRPACPPLLYGCESSELLTFQIRDGSDHKTCDRENVRERMSVIGRWQTTQIRIQLITKKCWKRSVRN